AVERFALVLVAEDFIGGIQLGKTLGRLRIVLVGVGMQFLGLPTEGALDLVRGRGLLHTNHVIGIAHCFAALLISTCLPWNRRPRAPNVGASGSHRNNRIYRYTPG